MAFVFLPNPSFRTVSPPKSQPLCIFNYSTNPKLNGIHWLSFNLKVLRRFYSHSNIEDLSLNVKTLGDMGFFFHKIIFSLNPFFTLNCLTPYHTWWVFFRKVVNFIQSLLMWAADMLPQFQNNWEWLVAQWTRQKQHGRVQIIVDDSQLVSLWSH